MNFVPAFPVKVEFVQVCTYCKQQRARFNSDFCNDLCENAYKNSRNLCINKGCFRPMYPDSLYCADHRPQIVPVPPNPLYNLPNNNNTLDLCIYRGCLNKAHPSSYYYCLNHLPSAKFTPQSGGRIGGAANMRVTNRPRRLCRCCPREVRREFADVFCSSYCKEAYERNCAIYARVPF